MRHEEIGRNEGNGVDVLCEYWNTDADCVMSIDVLAHAEFSARGEPLQDHHPSRDNRAALTQCPIGYEAEHHLIDIVANIES